MFAGELLHNSYVKHKIGKADTEQGMISDQWETSWFSPTLLGWEVVNVFPENLCYLPTAYKHLYGLKNLQLHTDQII